MDANEGMQKVLGWHVQAGPARCLLGSINDTIVEAKVGVARLFYFLPQPYFRYLHFEIEKNLFRNNNYYFIY